MVVHLEITDPAGFREVTWEEASLWFGSGEASDVRLEIPNFHGRAVELRTSAEGGIELRALPSLPFPVRSSSGSIGTRFETVLEGDVLNIGPAMLRVRRVRSATQPDEVQDLDLASVGGPGAPVGSWYQTFMDLADHLEGLADPERMVHAALEAAIHGTGADRAHLSLHAGPLGDGRSFFLNSEGRTKPFRVSNNLIDRVQTSGRVVHVPVASEDPVASQFQSVRREGISSGIALPLKGMGRSLGVLYVDCVREGAVLTADDLQRVVFLSRLLASSLGNRDLMSSLVRAEAENESGAHPALQSQAASCREMVERVQLYAPTDYTVLLRGETGTGKEVVARAIHELSRRAKGPFVPVNCAAIPDQLMESMLFGHEKGAFTGATETRAGHFEEAHGGTILLDEIGDMALELQAKILRVLQDRVVTPVGARRQVRVDVRILAATHQDLEQMVKERRFREDLYYRLRELEVILPPLRERTEDILMLCGRFLEEAAEELGFRNVPEIASETLDHLQRRPWRGNIRELRHLIKGAALRAGGAPLRVEHIDHSPLHGGDAVGAGGGGGESDPNMSWKERLEFQERAALRETFEAANGNLTKAAEMFGVPRTTYREKLVKAGLLEKA